MGKTVLSWLRSEIRKVKEVARLRRFFFIFSLDEFRLKNPFKKIFEKSIDIFRKSAIIINVKRTEASRKQVMAYLCFLPKPLKRIKKIAENLLTTSKIYDIISM